MILALALLLTTGDPDPRVPLIELQLENRRAAALARIERLSEERPELVAPLGLDYLRGELLESLGRQSEAYEAFVDAFSNNRALAPYSRYRMAASEARSGHPEVAAGLLATLLGDNPPQPLVGEATRLFVRSLERGGDCRLVARHRSWRLPTSEQRLLRLAAAECARRRGDREREAVELDRVLAADSGDGAAWEAAGRLLAGGARITTRTTLRVGLTLHQHRDFSRSTRLLREALARVQDAALPGAAVDDARYALARNSFWLGEYAAAAEAFGALAQSADPAEIVARALYQQGRSLELHGAWGQASNSYRRAYLAEPEGRWAAASLVAALRIEWRSGAEEPALEAYGLLGTRRSWRGPAARAALFMASSDIIRGRTDRADGWLDAVERRLPEAAVESAYWRGRLSEARDQPEEALSHYLRALRSDPYHPLGQLAAARLAGELAEAAETRLLLQARSSDPLALYEAWLALGEGHPAREPTRQKLVEILRRDPRIRPFLEARLVPPAEWPLWQVRLQQPEELLLAMGLWELGAPVIMKHFPVSDVSLGYTGSRLLAEGGATRRSLYVAEVLARSLPRGLPPGLLPTGLRRLLYPFPFRAPITREAEQWSVDPYLLTAIIREESRFDPQALSGAAARGLTQFILPTARRLASAVEMPAITAEDLHQPEISIALGAAYLDELAELFGGREHLVLAAYNAGEPQAQLWRSYCYSHDPAEYFSKVGFPQTRAYLAKVLASRAQYEELYGGLGD